MAESDERNRFTSLSADNHQPWLWFVHVFSLIFVFLTAILRARIKRRRYGMDDLVLLIGHVLYIAYWIILLMALLSSLGKSEKVTSTTNLTQASNLVFGSRILLSLVLCAAKASGILLIYNIFTKSVEPSRASLYILLGLVAGQGLVGALLVSASCSPDRVVYVGEKAACSNTTVRWIIFTVFETLLECAPFARVISQAFRLQVTLGTKIFVVAAFSTRLVTLAPAWVHIVCYQRFQQLGQTNIGIVSTIITEELWASIALLAGSIPVLMRVAKKFSTSREVGDRTAIESRYNKSSRSKKTPDQSIAMDSSKTSPNGKWQLHKNSKTSSYLNDDNYTTVVFPNKAPSESINSTAESQVGILREVQVEVSSLHMHT